MTYANVVNVPIPGSPRFEQDTAMAIARLRASLGPTGTPTFSSAGFTGLTANKPVYADASKVLQSVTVGTSLTFATPPTLNTIQDIRTTASPTFVTAKLTGLTDTYIPYHAADATGLADSNITYNGTTTKVNLGADKAFSVETAANYVGAIAAGISVATATSAVVPLSITNACSMNTGGYAYGIYNNLSNSTIMGGSAALYFNGIYNWVSKTGADTNDGTARVYGVNSTAIFTDYTDVGHHQVYGGFFNALGSAGGDSEAYGVYCTAAGLRVSAVNVDVQKVVKPENPLEEEASEWEDEDQT